jgi:hypothetical protein
MEKIKKQQKAILNLLEYYAAIKSPFMPDVENKVIADTKNHEYQLIRLGWHENKHIHYTVFHFSLVNNQVWVHENRTDLNLDQELINFGIALKDIRSGMEAPSERAVAA